ncbi:carbohydrate ABC transporter permease [Clostridium grantii]|uniref:Putative aldouronate transport system permease protein n=1 Tax=Clostridium grantii DSM 8605 TaxID=1121316 RepID=A0A1M5VVH6_9CLOT|nr:carbohydrate ABC transporter permease [Clostridium grantii]SHH79255.1 putative aldouronate transport system permease protein [Clostridium grantii DSM 8605]
MSGHRFYKSSKEDIIVDTVINISLTFLLIVTLYPFLNMIAVSLNDATDSLRGGIYLWPREFTLYNYKNILKDTTIYHATMISVLRTVIGTTTSLVAHVILAYILSRKDFVFRKPLTAILVLTMYFSGGLIPTYFLFRSLHLLNSFNVYIVPALLSAFNVIIIRTYIEGLPNSLIESAKIDGANEMQVLIKIITPLILPVIATVALFISVGQWNSWFDTYIFASSNEKLSTLQYELMKKLASAQQNMSASGPDYSAKGGSQSVTPNSIRATMTIIATAPILCVYPFLQKYFITGLTLGGVKE